MSGPRLAPAAVCVALLLAGCGGGEDKPGTAAPAPAAPSPAASVTSSPTALASTSATPSSSPSSGAEASAGSLSLAQAKRLGTAGVLASADLPGWTRAAQTLDDEDAVVEQATKKCLKLALTPYLHRDLGYTYTKGTTEINSNVDIASTKEQATKEIEALGGAKGAECYRQGVLAVFPPDGVTVTIESIAPKIAGADRAIGYRLTAHAEGPEGSLDISGYQIVALVGQTEIWLDSGEETKTPAYRLDDLRKLAETLVARVKAAS